MEAGSTRPESQAFFSTAVTSIQGHPHHPNIWWRYLVMLAAVLFGILFIGTLVTLGLIAVGSDDLQATLQSLSQASSTGIDMSGLGMAPWVTLAVVVANFACGLIPLLILTKPLHNRPLKSIITGASRFRWKRVFMGLGLWLGITVVLEVVNYQLSPGEYRFSFDPEVYWPSLLAAIVLFPLQTSFEEIAFRGYLMQGIGLASRKPWLALLLSSLAFGLLHAANPEVGTYGPVVMVYYIGTGLFLGLITLMDEGLELALGIHFVNNLYGASGVGFPSSVFTYPSVYQMENLDFEMSLLGWFIMAALCTGIFTLLFGWRDWGKLFRSIALPPYPKAPVMPHSEAGAEY